MCWGVGGVIRAGSEQAACFRGREDVHPVGGGHLAALDELKRVPVDEFLLHRPAEGRCDDGEGGVVVGGALSVCGGVPLAEFRGGDGGDVACAECGSEAGGVVAPCAAVLGGPLTGCGDFGFVALQKLADGEAATEGSLMLQGELDGSREAHGGTGGGKQGESVAGVAHNGGREDVIPQEVAGGVLLAKGNGVALSIGFRVVIQVRYLARRGKAGRYADAPHALAAVEVLADFE